MSTTHVHVLNCGHTVTDDKAREVRAQVRCPECSDTIGKVVRPRITSTGPAVEVKADPDTGPSDADVAQALDTLKADDDQSVAPVVSMASARMDRYERAKAAAANGGDVAAVLSEPLPAAPTSQRRRSGSRPDGSVGRLRWVNGHRADALRALADVDHRANPELPGKLGADVQAAIESGRPFYFDQATLDFMLDRLPSICEDSDAQAHTAACRLHSYLVKTYRSDQS